MPKESAVKKGHPKACPLCGFPALLGKTGARRTRDLASLDYAQTGGALSPVFPAMLGGTYGIKNPAPTACPVRR